MKIGSNDVNTLRIIEQQSRLFLFPPIEQIPTNYPNLEEIERIMDLALRNHNEKCLPNNRIEKTMKLTQVESGAVYRCKEAGCRAYLNFLKKGDNYYLSQHDPEHEHRIKANKKGRLPKIKNSEVEECHDELQLLNFKPRQIVDFIRAKFKISKAHYYGIKFCRNRRENIRNLLMALSKYDHFFFECKDMRQLVAHYKKQKYPDNVLNERDIIVIISRRMKQLYESYHGQYVYFSMFPDIVLETRYTKTLHYHNIAILYGEDATGSLNLIFGLVIFKKSVRLAYLYVLEKMFAFLGKYPKVIITDYDQALVDAIKRLKERTKIEGTFRQHIQLPYTFLSNNNFQTKVSPQFTSSLSSDLENTLRDGDYKSHQVKFKTILENNENCNHYQSRQKIGEELQKYVRANSILHLQPLFIGLSLTPYSTYALLKSRVLDYFKSPRPMILAVKAFFQIFSLYPVLKFLSVEQINSRLNTPKEPSTKIQKLHLLQMISKTLNPKTKMKPLTKALSSPAALYFYDTLQQCFQGEIVLVEVTKTNYFYRVIENQTNYPYTIKKVKEVVNGSPIVLWRCDCKLYFKSGLPCWHELKTCLCEGSDVTLQVNPYWVVDSKPLQSRPSHTQTEHDIKNWYDGETQKSNDDLGPQNLSQVVSNAPNERPKNYFDYGDNGLSQPPEGKQQPGMGELIQQLGVLEWQMNSLNQQNEIKKQQCAQLSQLGYLTERSIMEGLKKLQEQSFTSNRENVSEDEQQLKYFQSHANKNEANQFYFQNSEHNSSAFKETNGLKQYEQDFSLDFDELQI